MRNQLELLYLSLQDLVEPLPRRIDTLEGLEHLAYRYGWNAPLDEAAFERILGVWGIGASLQHFLTVAEEIQERVEAEPRADLTSADIARLADSAIPLVTALARFRLDSFDGLVEPYDRTEFWESLGDHLLDDLLEEYLRIHRPGFYLVLRLWGAIRYEPTHPPGPFRRPYTRVTVDWAQVGAIVREPLGALLAAYHWGEAEEPFAHQQALESLATVLNAVGLPTRVLAPAIDVDDPFPLGPGHHVRNDTDSLRTILRQGASAIEQTVYRVGFEVFPAVRAGEDVASGLLVRPLLQGSAGSELPLGRRLALRWSVAASAGDSLGFALFPDEVEIVGGEPALGTRLEVRSTGQEPWYLLGNERTSRIELSDVAASLSMGGSLSDPEIELRVGARRSDGGPGCRVVVSLADADAFVEQFVDSPSVDVSFTPELVWSNRSGLSFNGMRTPRFEVPLNIGLGPVTLTNLSVEVEEGDRDGAPPSISCRVGLGLHGRLGPLSLMVEQVGFTCDVVRYTRQDLLALPPGEAPALGTLGVDLSFAPPKGIGLAIDAKVVSGTGYLYYDPEAAQYAGAVQVEVNGLTLQAVGLITTRMPDGSRGYSLLVILSASDFTPIQLPFGFRLTGVGGLLGLNRTANVEALRAGLKSRSLDAILFPEDPVANVAGIVRTLQTVMPARDGQFLAGVMGRFTWGVPTVMTIELGVVLELPNPLRMLILGQFRVLLPSEERVLVRLQMDALGVIDWDRSHLSVDAVLYDSHVLEQTLTGEMALRARWGDDPTFLLAVGGVNPNYSPPAGFPTLARAALTVSRGDRTRLRMEAYFALSSNTAQVGARAELLVRASGFSVEGSLGFDALFQFSPFMFIVDMRAGVTLKWHGRTLLGVDLELTLSGPSPWHARGRATFKIWRFSKSISFDRICGADQPAPTLPAADPMPALVEALADGRNWGAQLAPGMSTVITLSERGGADELLLHPLGDLTVSQRIVPLGIRIDRFGNTTPAGDRSFRIEVTTADGGRPEVTQPVLDYFAPAQFLELNDSNRLRRPSFELMEAGLRIGAGLSFGGEANAALVGEAPIEYETIPAELDGDENGVTRLDLAPAELRELLAVEAYRVPGPRPGRSTYAAPGLGIDLPKARYVVASKRDLAHVALAELGEDGALSYTAAAQALWRHEEEDPGRRGELQVVTVFAMEGATS